MRIRLFIALLILLIAGQAWGATYYLRHDGAVLAANKASATSCAAAETAMSLAQHNAATFSAGDTIYLCSDGGDFTGTSLVPPTSGSLGSAIAYVNAPTETPSIDGTGLTDGVTISAARHYISLSGISFKGSPAQHIQYVGTAKGSIISNCTFTGAPTYAVIKALNPALTITNFNVSSLTSARLIYLTGTTSAFTVTGGTITAALSGRSFATDEAADITISGLTATISTNAGDEPGSFFYANTNNAGIFNILNNTITYNLTAGAASDSHIISVQKGTRTVNVTGNSITCLSSGQTPSAIDILNQPTVNIMGNTINYGSTNAGVYYVISVRSTAATVTANISNNTVYTKQNGGIVITAGIDTKGAGDNKIDGAILSGNKIYADLDTNPHLLECGHNKNCTITKNYLYGGRHGVVVKGGGAWSSGVVAYNVAKDQSMNMYYSKGAANVPFYNNVVYRTSGRTTTEGLFYVGDDPEDDTAEATGCVIKNNIVVTDGGVPCIWAEADSSTGLVADYNLYYLTSGASPFYAKIGATTYEGANGFTNWQSAGYDVHGIAGSSPLFISSTDYHLKSGSPAINAGVDVGLTIDYDGKPIAGKPDIGAYERRGKFF